MSNKLYTIRVTVWEEYTVEVEAESEDAAISFVEEHINEIEEIGLSSDGGRDINERDIHVMDIDKDDTDEDDTDE